MREPALRVKMPANIPNGDQARVSLRHVEPIPTTDTPIHLLASQPNVNAVAP